MIIPDLRCTTGNSTMGHVSSLENVRISDDNCGFSSHKMPAPPTPKPQNPHHRRASLVPILSETFLMETFHPFLNFAQLFFLPLHLLK